MRPLSKRYCFAHFLKYIIKDKLSVNLKEAANIIDKAVAGGEITPDDNFGDWIEKRFLPNLVFIDERAQYRIIDGIATPLISGIEAEEVEKAIESKIDGEIFGWSAWETEVEVEMKVTIKNFDKGTDGGFDFVVFVGEACFTEGETKYGFQNAGVKLFIDREELKKFYEKNRLMIQGSEMELQKMKDEIEKQRSVLTESALKDKETAYQQKFRDYQALVKEANENLQTKDQEVSKDMIAEAQKIINSIGEKEKYTVIFDPSTVPIIPFHSMANDLTKRVMDEFNKTYKPKK